MSDRSQTIVCPDCGAPLSNEPWAGALCLECLARLALEVPSLAERIEGEAETLTFEDNGLIAGGLLGGRYRIRSKLGQGGMGEVWLAFDQKLRVDVALKAVRAILVEDEGIQDALRSEVRAARDVVSPNVCRVFDLEEIDDQELVSMEYIDGTMLIDILRERGPLPPDEAREIASQFLAGLEAIHIAGLVHRDVKPENIMVTKAGRVVVMDFGVAKSLEEERTGTISGTPAYMPPEQACGDVLDARADVFAAGVVLAEMVSPGGLGSIEARQQVWNGIHREPPELADSPWAGVIAKAVSAHRRKRYVSAAALARALEEVTQRVVDDEVSNPYPGLASFTEADAEYFFGRELEVEGLWKKLRQPHLLALIGPSGAGKSSFLRAGLLSTMPTGWTAIVSTPGNRPFGNLAQTLADVLTDDAEAMRQLLRFEEVSVAVGVVSRWRETHSHALVIIDQFEELFTQNPEDAQARFTELLAILTLKADVHVLLSMRDDFLFHCQRFEALKPIFSDLTPLGVLGGAGLRRALVQPALKCGYRFEDDQLVDEMLADVAGERGALPMLAFTASRLWDLRDREDGVITRRAYEQVGGVGGALAQHAEATLERVGRDQIPMVREIFRNLVTAHGTRATRERHELLSVFDTSERESASEVQPSERTRADQVLDALIDARLLTSYEVPAEGEGDEPQQRIEVIHESLLSSWPRLVRWQAQEEEGALLRDQLRQAAQMWEERDHPEDLLWTGTSFKEYELWRERYGGGLSSGEEAFAKAMVAKSRRRRRRRRLAVAGALIAAIVVAAITGTLWRRSEAARQEAVAQSRRAEAQKLLALGRLEFERFPTATLAYAISSLELTDTPESRRLALEALWRGPSEWRLPQTAVDYPRLAFSADGSLLGATGTGTAATLILSRGGGEPEVISTPASPFFPNFVGFGDGGRLLVTSTIRFDSGEPRSEIRILSRVDGSVVETQEDAPYFIETVGDRLVKYRRGSDRRSLHEVVWRPLDGDEGAHRVVVDRSALSRPPERRGCNCWALHPDFSWIAVSREGSIVRRDLMNDNAVDVLWKPGFDLTHLSLGGDNLAALAMGPGIRISVFDLVTRSARSLVVPSAGREANESIRYAPKIDVAGSRLVWGTDLRDGDTAWVWDLDGPPHFEPLTLLPHLEGVTDTAITNDGRWVVMASTEAFSFFSLEQPYALRLRTDISARLDTKQLAFSPDSSALASCSFQGGAWIWPLDPSGGDPGWAGQDNQCDWIAANRKQGGFVAKLLGGDWFAVAAGSVDSIVLEESQATVDRDPTGHHAASYYQDRLGADEHFIRIRDLETSESRDHPTAGALQGHGFGFDGTLYTAGEKGLRRWDLDEGSSQVLYGREDQRAMLALSADGRFLVAAFAEPESDPWLFQDQAMVFDLEAGSSHELTTHGSRLTALGLDAAGRIVVSGDEDGVVRVGRANGEEPHLLLGHRGIISALAVSPDGRWIASAAGPDIRLWPMPDLEVPPLHTLPQQEILSRLRTLTNYQVVEDRESPTGWALEVAPFPGWADTPIW